MTEIIVKKRDLNDNEFTFSPIASFTYTNFKPLFSYIERNSNLIIEDISSYTDNRTICFRVVRTDE